MNRDNFTLARQAEARGVIELIQQRLDDAMTAVSAVEDLEKQVVRSDIPASVYAAIASLDLAREQLQVAKNELVAYLATQQNLSQRKIAEGLGISPPTVKTMLLAAQTERERTDARGPKSQQ